VGGWAGIRRATPGRVFHGESPPADVQEVGGERERLRAASAWLASRDPGRLAAEARAAGGGVAVSLDGRLLRLRHGQHFAVSGPTSGSAAQLANGN